MEGGGRQVHVRWLDFTDCYELDNPTHVKRVYSEDGPVVGLDMKTFWCLPLLAL